jgi:hypothetical protein
MVRKIFAGLFLLSMVFAMASCGGSTVPGTENGVYSRYKLHYVTNRKGVSVGSYANWTRWEGHAFVPYNAKLQVKAIGGKKFEIVASTSQGIKTITWEFDPKNMGMSGSEYIKLITSPNPVSYEGLSGIDRQGIEAGKALPGMSKQGVNIALGYPAKHKTPSLESNKWVYWTGRYDPMTVEFDSNGKVK